LGPNDVFSLDFAYEGKPAAAKDNEGNIWLFYHTVRNGKWDIWYKTRPHEQTQEKPEEEKWTPSQPLTGADTIDKYPTAVFQGETLWVFWSSCNQDRQAWEVKCRKRINKEWIEVINSEDKDKLPDSGNQRKTPCAVVDHNNNLWLFWLEKKGNRWQLKYNRHTGSKWKFSPSVGFTGDETGVPRVEKDLFVLYRQEDNSIWVFWSRKKSRGISGQECWEIAYREKISAGSWGDIKTLPKEPANAVYHDCEPAAIVNADGEIELYWASNRKGSWSIWTIKLENGAPIAADDAEMLIDSPYSLRTPLPVAIDNVLHVIHRSNRCISYKSCVYGAAKTTDFRYSGCTTVYSRSEVKIGLWRKFDDFQTYTYDTGKNGKPKNDDWYARDTFGVYMTPNTEDQQLITLNRELVKGVLERFLPIQTRSVFIINPPVPCELIYTYDFPKEEQENPRHIEEQSEDQLTVGPVTEVYPGVSDTYEDKAPGWTWFRSVKVEYIDGQEHVEYTDHRTVNVDAAPIDTGFRTWHIGITGGQ